MSLISMILSFSSMAIAEDMIDVVFKPSIDEAAIGHILYWSEIDEDGNLLNKDNPFFRETVGDAEYNANGDILIQLPLKFFGPDKAYRFWATAYDVNRYQSVPSNSLDWSAPVWPKAPEGENLPTTFYIRINGPLTINVE
jgi:hypothetical protein